MLIELHGRLDAKCSSPPKDFRQVSKNSFTALLDAVKLNPENGAACAALATAHYEREEFHASMEWLERALRLEGPRADRSHQKGLLLERAACYKQAQCAFLEAAQYGGDSRKLALDLARLELKEGNNILAASLLLAEGKRHARSQTFFDLTAGILLDSVCVDEAQEYMQGPISLSIHQTEILAALALQLSLRGRHKEATRVVLDLAKVNPKHPWINKSRALMYRDERDYLSAWLQYADLLDDGIADEQTAVDYALFLFSIGEVTKARNVFFHCWYQPLVLAQQSTEPGIPRYWDGIAHPGESILLSEPLRFGDVLMFSRFARWFSERGMKTIVETRPTIKTLCNKVPGAERAVLRFDDYEQVAYKVQLDWLPLLIDETPADFARYSPYFQGSGTLPLRFMEGHSRDAFTVGIAWQGSRSEQNSPYTWRSATADVFRMLVDLPTVRCVSLQIKDGRQVSGTEEELDKRIVQLEPNMKPFTEVSSVIATLDMVVTIDSALAHLAGGLGVLTYLMLPFTADWRWFTVRSDSPWYPSMRLFRQDRPGDWTGVMSRILPEIEALATEKLHKRK